MDKNQSGSSLVEVMIMMVIMSISIVGIYSMVNAGQRLAQTTDTKRIALAIAREGIESTTNIRDTFALRKYSVDSNAGCFFSIDATNYGDCPETGKEYILLSQPAKLQIATTSFPVCINANGWYSQESCTSGTKRCLSADERSCRTIYERRIFMTECADITDKSKCIQVNTEVRWWASADQQVTLSQVLTKHD